MTYDLTKPKSKENRTKKMVKHAHKIQNEAILFLESKGLKIDKKESSKELKKRKRSILNKKYYLSELIRLYKDEGHQILSIFNEEMEKLNIQLDDCNSKLEKESVFHILEEIKAKLSKSIPKDIKEDNYTKKLNRILENLILFNKDEREIKEF